MKVDLPIDDIVSSVLARWRLILFVTGAMVAITLAISIVSAKTYTARSSLLFDERAPDPSLQNALTSEDTKTVLGTQADIVKSETVAKGVIASLNLGKDKNLRAEWREDNREANYDSWLVQHLLRQLDVTPDRDTNVLSIRYDAKEPQQAAAVANAFADSYLSLRLKISTAPARQYAEWFDQQVEESREQLDKAQAALARYQQDSGLIDGDSLEVEADRLRSLSVELATAEANAADLRSRAGNQVLESPDVQNQETIQHLRQRIASQAAEVRQLAEVYGENHPNLQTARAVLDQLNGQLASETQLAGQSVRVANSAAQSREAQLRSLVSQQRQRMLAMSTGRGQLQLLENDVEVARRTFEEVAQKRDSMHLQSGLPATKARQLDIATPPLLPSSPNVPLRLTIAILVGLLLSVGGSIALEWSRPLVRTPVGVIAATDAPVLGIVSFRAQDSSLYSRKAA